MSSDGVHFDTFLRVPVDDCPRRPIVVAGSDSIALKTIFNLNWNELTSPRLKIEFEIENIHGNLNRVLKRLPQQRLLVFPEVPLWLSSKAICG